jgi:hypothetical protein
VENPERQLKHYWPVIWVHDVGRRLARYGIVEVGSWDGVLLKGRTGSALVRFTEDGHLYDIEASGEVVGNDVLCALEAEYGVLLRVLPGDRPAP